MQHSQFFRVTGYGREPGHRDPDWATIEQVAAEGGRLPHASRHVAAPRPPLLLHGVPPTEAGRLAVETAEQARDGIGRRMRRDGRVLYAAVASYPLEWTVLESEKGRAEYFAWRERVLGYLKRWLGERLVSVVEHIDEPHPHVHAFIVPALTPSGQLDLSWHPGHVARERARRAGRTHADREKAYRQGLRDCLDRFHEAVSAPSGHARLGARRTRLRRREALAMTAAAGVLAEARSTANRLIREVEARATDAGLSEAAAAARDTMRALDAGFAEAAAMLLHHRTPSTRGNVAVLSGHSDIADARIPAPAELISGLGSADDGDIEVSAGVAKPEVDFDDDPEAEPANAKDSDDPDFDDISIDHDEDTGFDPP